MEIQLVLVIMIVCIGAISFATSKERATEKAKQKEASLAKTKALLGISEEEPDLTSKEVLENLQLVKDLVHEGIASSLKGDVEGEALEVKKLFENLDLYKANRSASTQGNAKDYEISLELAQLIAFLRKKGVLYTNSNFVDAIASESWDHSIALRSDRFTWGWSAHKLTPHTRVMFSIDGAQQVIQTGSVTKTRLNGNAFSARSSRAGLTFGSGNAQSETRIQNETFDNRVVQLVVSDRDWQADLRFSGKDVQRVRAFVEKLQVHIDNLYVADDPGSTFEQETDAVKHNSGSGMRSLTSELEKLVSLLNSGHITQAEFETAKSKLLAS